MMIREVSFQQQTFSFSATTKSVSRAETPAAPADAVELSREAKAAAKAEKIMAALDANQDGAVSQAEFTEGALSLLRRASQLRQGRGDRLEDARHRGDDEVRGHRWERRLERAFDRIDANEDGSVNVAELTQALLGGRRGAKSAAVEQAQVSSQSGSTGSTGASAPSTSLVQSAPSVGGETSEPSQTSSSTAAAAQQPTQTSAAPSSAGSASATFTSFSFRFTFVSVAVRQYQAAGQEPTTEPTRALAA